MTKRDPNRVHAEYVTVKLHLESQIRYAESLITTARRNLEEAFEAYMKARLERCFKTSPAVGTRVRWIRASVELGPDKDLTGTVVGPYDGYLTNRETRVEVKWDTLHSIGAPPWAELEPLPPTGDK